MRVVVQRVTEARVRVEGDVIGEIGLGLLLLISAGEGDTLADVDWIVNKILNLRVFPDEQDRMNRSLLDVGGELLAVSQFTLHGDCRKGHRPSFVKALVPDAARNLFDAAVERLRNGGMVRVATGRFGASMAVELVNDGPVTLLLDSKKAF